MPILVYSPNGKYIAKATLKKAFEDSDTAGKSIVITTPIVVGDILVLTGGRSLNCENNGVLTFSGSGSITGLPYARPEYFGANTTPGVTDMTAAIQNALVSSDIVMLGNTIYKHTGVNSSADNKTIIGESKPTLNASIDGYNGSTLIGGSILISGKYFSIENVIIDTRGVRGANATGADGLRVGGLARIESVILMGDDNVNTGVYGTNHGISLETSGSNKINDIDIIGYYHGIAARTSNNRITKIRSWYCYGDTVILKSINAPNNLAAEHNLVDDIERNGGVSDS